ncbi:hypothetical protein BDV12DRAFT_127483 [Aspergillus spectabilis]
MADEQFPWLDWPHNYLPQNMGQKVPRVEETTNPHWRSPFYNSSSSSRVSNSFLQQQPPVNNNNSQSQYYPSHQQEAESYVMLEDVLPYPSYRWGPPPAHEYQRQTSYPENTSGISAPSLHQQSPKRPAADRRLPNPMPQAGSGEAHLANDAYANHEAKRRRLDPPVASQAPQKAVPKVASLVYSQFRTQPAAQDARSGSRYTYPSTTNAARAPNPALLQAVKQPTVQRTSQPITRPGSQYAAPVQQQSRSQVPPRTASPATSQIPAQRVSQYAPCGQSTTTSRAPSSARAQTAAQRTSNRNSQHSSPNPTSQALRQTVAPAETQITPPLSYQLIPRPSSQYASQQRIPQSTVQNSSQAATHAAAEPTAQRTSQKAPKPSSKSALKTTSYPALQSTTQPTSQPPPSRSVSRPAAPSATTPVQHHVPQTLPPQRSSSTQKAPPGPEPSGPPQTTLHMAQEPPSQPLAPGPQGKFAAYSYQPENTADRTHLKRRMGIANRMKEEDVAEKLTYDPRTIARDVLIAAGRHPTEPSLNDHLSNLRGVFSAVDHNTDMETFRWDLVDPGEPSRDVKAKTSAPIIRPQPTFQQPARPPRQPKTQPPPQSQLQPQTQPQVRVQFQSQRQALPVSVPWPQPEAETPSTPKSQMDKPRRRGRPPGSVNKPKVAPVVPRAPSSSFPVFACRWGNCQSELHNLDLLKKHIFKSHVSYQITCGWKSCTFTGTLPARELMKHVKQDHLDSLAWKLGDGPAVPTSVDQGSGANTVPLTIPESHQQTEDSLIFPANYSSIRAFNRVHGKNMQDEKAMEIFKAVQRLKEHIGVGLDPGGCQIATPSRNERVSNDEDFYEVRSGS